MHAERSAKPPDRMLNADSEVRADSSAPRPATVVALPPTNPSTRRDTVKISKALRHWVMLVFAVLAAAVSQVSLAQQSEIDPEAIQLLRRSTDHVAAQKQFRVDTETLVEVVLTTGQKLQFGTRVAITVQRPDRLRAERVGELVNQTFYYDGETLVMHLPDQKYYAMSPAPPTIDGMLDFARDKLNVIAPGADLIYSNAFERLTEGLTSAFVVGTAVVGGVNCDQVAFRNPQVDWQIWIEKGDTPLPRKLIVTSKLMPQSPQFVVILSTWEPAPRIRDDTFVFVPPQGSRKIEFVPAAIQPGPK